MSDWSHMMKWILGGTLLVVIAPAVLVMWMRMHHAETMAGMGYEEVPVSGGPFTVWRKSQDVPRHVVLATPDPVVPEHLEQYYVTNRIYELLQDYVTTNSVTLQE